LPFVVPFAAASLQSDTHATLVAIAVGFAIGVAGHLTRSRTLVVIGILIIAIVSAYFAFALRPGSSTSFF
jgi:hypothetical protein